MPAAENLTKLFFFEEHPLMILGIQRLIEQEKNLELVGHSNDHQTLIDQLRKTRTDLLILDLTFYSSENFEFLQNIRNSLPNLKIIVFSVHTNPACTERVFKTGADGYILKTENPGRIIDAIQTIRNGKTYVSQTIRKPTKKSAATIDSPINLLSPQQFQILQRIGKGETKRQIAEELKVSLKTVEDQTAAIKEKLTLPSSSELIQFASHWVHHEGGFS